MNKCLPKSEVNDLSRFPFLLVYIATTLTALTIPSHKETRFMASIYPCIALTCGNGFVHIAKQTPKKLRYLAVRFVVLVYMTKELFWSIPQYKSDKATYTMFHERSPVTLDISN